MKSNMPATNNSKPCKYGDKCKKKDTCWFSHPKQQPMPSPYPPNVVVSPHPPAVVTPSPHPPNVTIQPQP